MKQHAERRLFFAALPDDASRDVLIAAASRYPKHRRLRWLAPEHWHVTLRFIGNVDESLVTPLSAALQANARRHEPTELMLDKIEPFPAAAKPLVLAATGRANVMTKKLVADLEQRCQAVGLAGQDRPFRAHLSLARVRGRRVLDTPTQPLSLVMPITHITLMESVPSAQGRRYVSLTTAPLAGVD